MDLIGHLQHYLGPVERGWNQDDTGAQMRFHVVRFGPGRPFEGVRTFSTVGVYAKALTLPDGTGVRQEFIVHTGDNDLQLYVPGILDQVGDDVISSGRGLPRGHVIGPHGPMFPQGEMTAFYTALPVYLPDEFATTVVGAATVTLTWLIPITTAEAELVQRAGWEVLEAAFEREDPDLTDLLRPSVRTAVPHPA